MKALAIVGATASGKTALSISVAKRFGCEIISCDSMQIYKYMNVGTAKATEAEQAEVPHHMIDFLSPHELYNASDYAKDAFKVAKEIQKRKKLPLFCGGTGLYLEAVRTGRHSPLSGTNEEYRALLGETAKKEGGIDKLYEMLLACDPESAEKIHKNNVKRVIRALEIYHSTGIRKSDWDKESKEIPPQIDMLTFCIMYKDREILYKRIDKRVDEMLKSGLREETEFLLKNGFLDDKSTASQAIGYKEYADFLRNEITEEEAVEKIKLATRHYAKRQLTWFSAQKDIIPIYADDCEKLKSAEEMCDEIEERAKSFLL